MMKIARISSILIAGCLIASIVDAPMQAGSLQSLPAAWVGTWTAAQYKVPLSSDLQVSVWGRNVFATRDVDLSVEPDGDSTLKIVEAVVDRRGRRKPFSTAVTEAHLTLREDKNAGHAARLVVTVTSAETRYLGTPEERVDMSGLVVTLSPVLGRTNEMNFRFDTPRGQGSFGDTLVRRSTRKATK